MLVFRMTEVGRAIRNPGQMSKIRIPGQDFGGPIGTGNANLSSDLM